MLLAEAALLENLVRQLRQFLARPCDGLRLHEVTQEGVARPPRVLLQLLFQARGLGGFQVPGALDRQLQNAQRGSLGLAR